MAQRSVAVNFTANTAQYTAGVGRAAAATGSLQTAAASVVRGLIGPGALVFALTQAVRWANATEQAHRSFATEMLKLETQIGLTTSEVQGMSQAVLSLAGATTKAPQELAEAMFFVASAGLRGAEAMEVLRSSARLSAVGLGETKVIADLLTSAVNAYGSETLSAARASDDLISAVRLGKLEADQLAGAMGRTLPIAAELGVTFNQVSGMMAAMSRTGTDAATASTQLRSIMVSLLNPAQQSVEVLTELGFTQRQVRDTIREDGLFDALRMLNDAVGDNREQLARLFPNQRALVGVLDLMGEGLAANTALMREHASAAGGAADAFAVFAEGAQAQVEQLAAQQERLQILQGQYQVGLRAAIRENRILRTQMRADRIAFGQDVEGMSRLLLDDLAPALDAFSEANFNSTVEMRRAIETSPGVRQAYDLLVESISRLHLNTDLVREGLDASTFAAMQNGSATLEQTQATLAFVEALILERQELDEQDETLAGLRAARALATHATSEAAREEDALARALGFTNAELREQINLLRDQFDERLALIDPVFAAVRAEDAYAQATQRVNTLVKEGKEGSDEYVTALFEQELAFLRMEAALAESGVVIDTFIEHLNEMAGEGRLTEGQLEAIVSRLREQGHEMDLLDGRVVRTSHIHTVVMENVSPEMSAILRPAELFEARARGGPVVAGRPYLVGEEGPELVVPSQSGTVIDAQRTRGLAGRPSLASSVPTAASPSGIVIESYNTFRPADDQALLSMLEMAQQAGRL